MPSCKLCGQSDKLIDAHIIPRAFYGLADSGEPAKIISSVPGRHPKRMRVGIYNSSILCEKCDGTLGRLDQHAAETLLPPGVPVRLTPQGDPICYVYPKANPVLIHRFVASVVWRASVSDYFFFKKVQLGPYEQRIARLLMESEDAVGDHIETVLGEFNEAYVPILDPHRIMMEGARYWVLYANRFTFYFKVDKRQSRGSMAEFALRPGAPVRAIFRCWRDSKALMADLARRYPNLYKDRA